MSDIEIIRYQPSLHEDLVEFRRRTYESGFPESRAYLEWKYDLNPFIPEPLFYIARDRGRIVGMRGAYGTRWEFGTAGETVVLPCADDFAVAPEYRSRGVAALIMREALSDLAARGHDFVVNTSGGRLTVLSSLAQGWRSAAAMESLVRLSPVAGARNVMSSRLRGVRGLWRVARIHSNTAISSAAPFARLDRMKRMTVAGGTIVAERLVRADAMAELVARLPYDGRLRQIRDATYLAWRYRNPIREYRFLYFEREGRLDGYLALARWVEFQRPTLPFHIVDWEGVDETVRRELLLCALRVARISELGTWGASRDMDMLHGAGFVIADPEQRARGLPCVLLKKLRGDTAPEAWTLGGASLLAPQRWDMRLLYSMHG
ncbi:MAG TPA: GNAT family N-acetyltransferase [Candidatus Krumholzibacteria bacterium]|nr:GNAT family N-acetyltransferase [Candidatus Krumholzibacteria bacterium]